MKQIIELTLQGYDADTDETDRLVLWVRGPAWADLTTVMNMALFDHGVVDLVSKISTTDIDPDTPDVDFDWPDQLDELVTKIRTLTIQTSAVMKTININEATPKQIDWLVAKCEDELDDFENRESNPNGPCFYTTDWAQGGPIIEREKIALDWHINGLCHASIGACIDTGPTPLIAAMRCFVASKLGDEVEIPEELQ